MSWMKRFLTRRKSKRPRRQPVNALPTPKPKPKPAMAELLQPSAPDPSMQDRRAPAFEFDQPVTWAHTQRDDRARAQRER